jgi:hypothetical protein
MSAVNMVVTSGLTTKTVLISKFVGPKNKFSMTLVCYARCDPRYTCAHKRPAMSCQFSATARLAMLRCTEERLAHAIAKADGSSDSASGGLSGRSAHVDSSEPESDRSCGVHDFSPDEAAQDQIGAIGIDLYSVLAGKQTLPPSQIVLPWQHSPMKGRGSTDCEIRPGSHWGITNADYAP